MSTEEDIHQDPDAEIKFRVESTASDVAELKKMNLDNTKEIRKTLKSFQEKIAQEMNSFKMNSYLQKEADTNQGTKKTYLLSIVACYSSIFLCLSLLVFQIFASHRLKSGWEKLTEEKMREALMLERTLRIFQEEIDDARKSN